MKPSKRTKGWCEACDKEIVEGGKRCTACGSKAYIKTARNRYSKITSALKEVEEIRSGKIEAKSSHEIAHELVNDEIERFKR